VPSGLAEEQTQVVGALDVSRVAFQDTTVPRFSFLQTTGLVMALRSAEPSCDRTA
jgi:hypothetical protein